MSKSPYQTLYQNISSVSATSDVVVMYVKPKNPEAAIFVATTLSGFGVLVTRSLPVCGSNSSFSDGSCPRATWERWPWISLLLDIFIEHFFGVQNDFEWSFSLRSSLWFNRYARIINKSCTLLYLYKSPANHKAVLKGHM